MELKDIVALTISVVSACVAVASVIIARTSLARQREMQGWLVNHNLLNKANEMFLNDHSLLALLGISVDEMQKDGITPTELVYINANLDAGSAWYRVSAQNHVILTEFRRTFLRNAKVRIAWKKYLRDRTFSSSPWTRAVDTYIAEVEAGECKSPSLKR